VDLHRELKEKNRRWQGQGQWQNDDSGEDKEENNKERSDMDVESGENDRRAYAGHWQFEKICL
jgi:hypothetical protein